MWRCPVGDGAGERLICENCGLPILADYYFGRPADPPNEKENDR